MKFARTIRMDGSDTNVFDLPAHPGEWAITGTFAFGGGDPSAWSNKQQLAFKSGWLGTGTFGRSTFVQVAIIPDSQFDDTVKSLATYLFQHYGAPGMLEAMDAARIECEDMAALCDHPAGTLLSIERELGEDGIRERVRIMPAEGDGQHARIWGIATEE